MARIPRIPRISHSEWLVMKVLWERSPRTANEVVDELTSETKWAPKTVKTLITRLVGKKAVSYKKNGREYLYSPAVDEAACVRAENKSFLKRVYGGALMPMIAHMIEEEALTDDEVAQLKRILEERRG